MSVFSTSAKEGESPESTSEMAMDPVAVVVAESSVIEPEVSPVMTAASFAPVMAMVMAPAVPISQVLANRCLNRPHR